MMGLKKVWELLLGTTSKKKYLFWYRYENSEVQNFGDIVGPVLLKELSGITVKHIKDKPRLISSKHIPHYLTVGSILREARKSSIVWGSGIVDSQFGVERRANYLAVRGPLTRDKVLFCGGKCPEVYGDPALLLPLIFPKDLKKNTKVTIIPHYVDYKKVKHDLEDYSEIDIIQMMTNDFNVTLKDIKSSNFIISSSLHGLILAVAYGIPCLWVEFSGDIFGDDIKYYDFFASLGFEKPIKHVVSDINAFILSIEKYQAIIVDQQKIKSLQKGLIDSYPFSLKKSF